MAASDQNMPRVDQLIDAFQRKPLLSILLPVYNTKAEWLTRCIQSVRQQQYPYWELCIADDASDHPHVQRILRDYEAMDERIKVHYRQINGHISEASNTALRLATGEFILLLDHDDELSEDALYDVANALNRFPNADMLYSDEDKLDHEGKRCYPFLKPDWSPETFLSHMYTCHLGVYRTTIARKIGGFRKGFEGAQDYDFVLRFTEITDRVIHIPKILYHWRMHEKSTAVNVNAKTYAFAAGKRALQEALQRRGEGGWVESSYYYPGQYRVRYPCPTDQSISIILQVNVSRYDWVDWVDQLLDHTDYKNVSFLMLFTSNDVKADSVQRVNKHPRCQAVHLPSDFSLKDLQRRLDRGSMGTCCFFIKRPFKMPRSDWLKDLAGYCLRPAIHSVYCKVYHPDYSFYPEVISNTVPHDYDGVMMKREALLRYPIEDSDTIDSWLKKLEGRAVFIPL
ncbi:hypothetical protein GCM10011391_17600 [Pullulanibacillus camelliae]|uniref:Glycosyltransferase 2-like domain-containing protein n=1 Tax=Pullulanibacillus camelliae TaxID=1707096 RepID=A0A8J2YD82_9BACL|nr:glycosyltransferase [Pullulanibacillus camelliae]GGE39302.1 hypothetical protein GCM10011391_17600 [Pullulanibacillus camelliae]